MYVGRHHEHFTQERPCFSLLVARVLLEQSGWIFMRVDVLTLLDTITFWQAVRSCPILAPDLPPFKLSCPEAHEGEERKGRGGDGDGDGWESTAMFVRSSAASSQRYGTMYDPPAIMSCRRAESCVTDFFERPAPCDRTPCRPSPGSANRPTLRKNKQKKQRCAQVFTASPISRPWKHGEDQPLFVSREPISVEDHPPPLPRSTATPYTSPCSCHKSSYYDPPRNKHDLR